MNNLNNTTLIYIYTLAEKLVFIYWLLGFLLLALLGLLVWKVILPGMKINSPDPGYYKAFKMLILITLFIGILFIGSQGAKEYHFVREGYMTALFNPNLPSAEEGARAISFPKESLGRLDEESYPLKEELLQFPSEKDALFYGYLKESKAQETREILKSLR